MLQDLVSKLKKELEAKTKENLELNKRLAMQNVASPNEKIVALQTQLIHEKEKEAKLS